MKTPNVSSGSDGCTTRTRWSRCSSQYPETTQQTGLDSAKEPSTTGPSAQSDTVSAETSPWEALLTNFSTQVAYTEPTRTKRWATTITPKIWPSPQLESQIWSTHQHSKYTTPSRTPTWWWIRTYNPQQQSFLIMRTSTRCSVKTVVSYFSQTFCSNSRTSLFMSKRLKRKPSWAFQDQASIATIGLVSSTAII